MARALIAAFAVAAAMAFPAFAQSGPSVRDLIAASTAPSDFADVSTGSQQRVRHLASGVTCGYGAAARPRTLDYRDNILVCTTLADADYPLLITQSSGRAIGANPVAVENAAAVKPLMSGIAGAQLVQDQIPNAFSMGGAPTRQSILTGQVNGSPLRVVVRTTVIGDWVIVQISAADPSQAADADRRSLDILKAAVANVGR